MTGEAMTTDQGGEPTITTQPGGEPEKPSVPKELWPVIDDIVGKKTAGIVKREREQWEREAAEKAKLEQMSEVEKLTKQLTDANAEREFLREEYTLQQRRAELIGSASKLGRVPSVYLDAMLDKIGPDDEFDANALAAKAYEQAMADATNLGFDPTKQRPKAPPPHGGTPYPTNSAPMTPEEIMAKARTDPGWYVKEGKRMLDKIRLGR